MNGPMPEPASSVTAGPPRTDRLGKGGAGPERGGVAVGLGVAGRGEPVGMACGLADTAAGRVELDPADAREVDLDPVVRLRAPDDLEPIGAAVARQEPVGDAGRHAGLPRRRIAIVLA